MLRINRTYLVRSIKALSILLQMFRPEAADRRRDRGVAHPASGQSSG